MSFNDTLASKLSKAEYQGWVYGLIAPGSNVLKIGMTKRLEKRLKEWKRCNNGYRIVGAVKTKYCRKLGE